MTRLSKINSWENFAVQVRKTGSPLLRELDNYGDSILVTGCQRSGTTMLARILAASDGVGSYKYTKDDELDAALILAGRENVESKNTRYCFQTTYVNECYPEYFNVKKEHKMIWVLRNPYSVIHSFLNNWGRFAFDELFRSCGMNLMSYNERSKLNLFGIWRIDKLHRACLSYNGKLKQIEKLSAGLPNIDIMFVEYDELVQNKNVILQEIYSFVELEYKTAYGDVIREKSINKADLMIDSDKKIIASMCNKTYEDACRLNNKIIVASSVA